MLLAIIFPSISFLIRGHIFTAVICFLLQLTLIGWLPAALWALSSRGNDKMEKKLNEMERKIIENQNGKR